MLKVFLNLFCTIILFYNVSSQASCATDCIPYEQRPNYTRESFNNYEDEGRMNFKLRFIGVRANDKISGLPTANNPSPQSIGSLLKFGVGGEGAVTYFISNKVAIELAAGCTFFRKRAKPPAALFNNYIGYLLKKGPTYMIPFSATGLYHIAPYGGLQPYVGAGFHAAYVMPKAKGISIRNHYGPVIQAGMDLVFKDLTLINFDIKQYFATPKISVSMPLLQNKITGKLKTNPLVFSVGFGFGF